MAGASILCGTDLTSAGPRTVDLAIAAAKAFGVRLDLVHVLDDADSWWPESAELQAAAEAAKELDLPLQLVDRDLATTLKRSYASVPWYKRLYLMAGLAMGMVGGHDDIMKLFDGREEYRIAAIAAGGREFCERPGSESL